MEELKALTPKQILNIISVSTAISRGLLDVENLLIEYEESTQEENHLAYDFFDKLFAQYSGYVESTHFTGELNICLTIFETKYVTLTDANGAIIPFINPDTVHKILFKHMTENKFETNRRFKNDVKK